MKTKMVYIVAALVLVFSMAAALIPAGPVMAATFDIPDGDVYGVNGLIAAINASNVNGVPDTINLAAGGTYTLNISDIPADGPNGLPSINSSITINGNGATIQRSSAGGTPAFRIFHVAATGNVTMSGMTIRNGNTTFNGGGIYNNGGNVTMTNCTISGNDARDGGGLYNNGGNLTMTNCTISENEATYFGAGIYRDGGEVTLTNCIVSGNTAGSGFMGGGIHNNGGAGDGLTMTGCTISGNTADQHGGGIYNNDELTMTNCTVRENTAGSGHGGGGLYNNGGNVTMTGCTVSGNEADDGGGIFNYGGHVTMTDCTVSDNTARDGNGGGISTPIASTTLEMTNCTISGNNASNDGGGIYNYKDEVTLTNCTVSDNEAGDDGGGIYNYDGQVTLTCTIVYGNRASGSMGSMKDVCNISDNGGTYTATECIIGDPDGDPDPLLRPLRDNGGPTETHALMTGSPAIDTCIVSCNLTTGQRGLPRPVDGDLDGTYFCDVGAYERQVAVGGTIEPVDRLELLAPWLGLAALMAVALLVLVVAKRRRVA